jgi:hypothetical protein
MKAIGLMTEDSRTYFEMLEALRKHDLKFVSLDFSEPIPASVGVVITTEAERERVDFEKVVTYPDPEAAIARARRMLSGEKTMKEIVIGIDPGIKPGFAVLSDGIVMSRSLAQSPESVAEMVDDVVKEYPTTKVIVRLGNGDRTNRNRIFNSLWDSGQMVEIVDERNTTKRSQTPDEDAAVEIAMTPGYRPSKRQETEPCEGEIRNIQRISRLESGGAITVSRELAKKVATGEMSLKDAIEHQRHRPNGNN